MLLEARSITADRQADAGHRRVLDHVDLSLGAGQLIDIVGPSGAGKTTLLLALARLLPDATGELALDGVSAADIAPATWRAAVALLQQKPTLVPGGVRANLLLPWTLKVRTHEGPPSEANLRGALDGVGLDDVGLERDVARLSVGQAARVALLRTLLTRPRVLLLDEPDASLDNESAALVTAAVRQFVADGGAAVRVRHLRADDEATKRYRLADGHLEEVASGG